MFTSPVSTHTTVIIVIMMTRVPLVYTYSDYSLTDTSRSISIGFNPSIIAPGSKCRAKVREQDFSRTRRYDRVSNQLIYRVIRPV